LFISLPVQSPSVLFVAQTFYVTSFIFTQRTQREYATALTMKTKAMKIGNFEIANPVIAAPMAGVTDKPYRQVCRENGAGLVVSEMITSVEELRTSRKTRYRSNLSGEPGPLVVQLVGTDPQQLAAAAQYNVGLGAQIIDINMGCPAKKVCKKAAGSALLANELLVDEILNSVVSAVDAPVTVKIRTGTTPESRNGVAIAKIAEAAGAQAITVHGRTRQCKFVGAVEYDTIAAVKDAVTIPVIANGDIDTPQKAKKILDYTNADAVMIGRAAQGQPWLFKQIADYLNGGTVSEIPSSEQRATIITDHLNAVHKFYGKLLGVRLARKHIKWYLQNWETNTPELLRKEINATEQPHVQLALIKRFLFDTAAQRAA